jgi:hypothetical protein
VVEQQLRRYFIGIISFGFIVTWIALGTFTAFLGLLTTVIATTAGPALLAARRGDRSGRRRHVQRRPPPRRVTARALADEDVELPLVPDEPSLIIGVSN